MNNKLYDKIKTMNYPKTIFVDYHDTLYDTKHFRPNIKLIEALIKARKRGVTVVLWTAAPFITAVKSIAYMEHYGLMFDGVRCGIEKGDLIIDDLAENSLVV